jgi:hypothetical protein
VRVQSTIVNGSAPKVIEGELVEAGRVVPGPGGRRRRRWPRVLGLGLLLAVGIGALFAVPWFRRADAGGLRVGGLGASSVSGAGAGASSPTAALTAWMSSFDRDGPNGDLLADRVVSPARRSTVGAARRDFRSARAADLAGRTDVSTSTLQLAGSPAPDPATAGDRVTVTIPVRVAFRYAGSPSGGGSDSAALPWRAEVRRTAGGWFLWSVDIPSWCAHAGDPASGYARCSG